MKRYHAIIAEIAHYQFATIHPYYDGNGQISRLLKMLILHLSGHDLKGLCSLEEYYAQIYLTIIASSVLVHLTIITLEEQKAI